jgi:23S rRNA (cytosine1962-C5)-methyltransferase
MSALKRSAPGALILTFSSSSHVDAGLFRKVAFGAALDAERTVQVLRTLGPAVDHPVSIYHPEGASLTGLLLQA